MTKVTVRRHDLAYSSVSWVQATHDKILAFLASNDRAT
jgi:hypothetical protein